MHLRSVVFPEPFFPSRPSTVPRGIARSTTRSASLPPLNTLRKPRTSIIVAFVNGRLSSGWTAARLFTVNVLQHGFEQPNDIAGRKRKLVCSGGYLLQQGLQRLSAVADRAVSGGRH